METGLNSINHLQQKTQTTEASVAILRQRLKNLSAWPEAGDEFLELLPLSRWHSLPLTKDDNHWLPSVVADSIDGVDIGSRYPAFFQKLLTNASLREVFLKALDKKAPTAL